MRCLRWVAAAACVGLVSSCAREPGAPVGPYAPVAPVASDASGPSSLGPNASAAPFQRGLATYYAQRFTGLRTANGERYDPRQMTAAHRSLAFGTMVEVRRTGAASRRAVIVRINDRGPYGAGRVIDLSRRAAEELGIVTEGKVAVELRVVTPLASTAH